MLCGGGGKRGSTKSACIRVSERLVHSCRMQTPGIDCMLQAKTLAKYFHLLLITEHATQLPSLVVLVVLVVVPSLLVSLPHSYCGIVHPRTCNIFTRECITSATEFLQTSSIQWRKQPYQRLIPPGVLHVRSLNPESPDSIHRWPHIQQ